MNLMTLLKTLFIILLTCIVYYNDFVLFNFYCSREIIYFSSIFIIISLFFLNNDFFKKYFYIILVLSFIFSIIININFPEPIENIGSSNISFAENINLIFLFLLVLINVKYKNNNIINKNIIFYLIIILFLIYSSMKLNKNNEDFDYNINNYNKNNIVYSYILNKNIKLDTDISELDRTIFENNKKLNEKIIKGIKDYIKDLEEKKVLKDKYLKYNYIDKKINKIFFIEISSSLDNINDYYLLKYEQDYLFNYNLEIKQYASYFLHFVFLFLFLNFIFFKKYFNILKNE